MTQASFSVDTLTEFLNLGDTHYRIFDLGRLVRLIPNDEFAAIEAGQLPYPTPLQGHAWLAILFWHKASQESSTPFIWFAKFPIDERGLLSHAPRQHFLQIIMEALGRDLTAETTPEQEELLKQNPYLFTPAEDKRAAFHAQVSQLLGQDPSIYFDDVESFILGKHQPEAWQQLGMQGLHDVAARLNNHPALGGAIQQKLLDWPQPFCASMAAALEHQQLPLSLQQNLTALLIEQCQLSTVNNQSLSALLRSLARSIFVSWQTDPELARFKGLHHALRTLLDEQKLEAPQEADLLIIIAARCWPLLLQSNLRDVYFRQLASHSDLFSHVFADLVAQPPLRVPLLMMMREKDNQSTEVRHAFEQLQRQLQR